MPTFTITIPPGEGTRVMNALCNNAGYEPTQPNALQALRDFMVETVRKVEQHEATLAALAVLTEPVPINPT